jgi:hypothetical protein
MERAIDREDQAIERWPIEGRIRPEGEEKRHVDMIQEKRH